MEKVVPFNVEHLDLMEFKPGELYVSQEGWRENLAALASLGVAYTYVVDGRPVLAAGFVIVGAGMANVWMLPTVYVSTYGHKIARKVKVVVDDFAATHLLHRMESRCPDTEDVADWMKYLGFTNPHRCHKAGVKQTDLILWERL